MFINLATIIFAVLAFIYPSWAQMSAETTPSLSVFSNVKSPLSIAQDICNAHWIRLPDGTAKLDPAWVEGCNGVFSMAHIDTPTPPAIPATPTSTLDIQQNTVQQQSLDFVLGVAGLSGP